MAKIVTWCVVLLYATINIQAQNKLCFEKNNHDLGQFQKGLVGEIPLKYTNYSKKTFEIVEITSTNNAVRIRNDYESVIKPNETQTLYALAVGPEKSGAFTSVITIYYMNKKKKERREKYNNNLELIKKKAKKAMLNIKGTSFD